jgi:hypothetical protein
MVTMRESIAELDIFDFDMPCDEENKEVFYLITKSSPEGYITVIPPGTIDEYLDLCESLRIEVYGYIRLGEL